jgi:hypothetical protein
MPILRVLNKKFTSGDALPGWSTTPTPGGVIAKESAQPLLAIPDPANPGNNFTYSFLFWNITGASNAGIHSTAVVDIQISTKDVDATSWYVKVVKNGPLWTGVFTYAFSETQDKFLLDIPIASVNPSTAWTPGNNKVETEAQIAPSGVDIFADSDISGEKFDLWLTFSGGTATGVKLHADTNAAIWAAIANYKLTEGVVPPWGIFEVWDELQEIRDRLTLVADPGPEDLWRIRKLLDRAQIEESLGLEDELTRVVSDLDRMTQVQMRGSLAAIKAQQVRLDAAMKMLEETLNKMSK